MGKNISKPILKEKLSELKEETHQPKIKKILRKNKEKFQNLVNESKVKREDEKYDLYLVAKKELQSIKTEIVTSISDNSLTLLDIFDIPPTEKIVRHSRNVEFVPFSDFCTADVELKPTSLTYHLVVGGITGHCFVRLSLYPKSGSETVLHIPSVKGHPCKFYHVGESVDFGEVYQLNQFISKTTQFLIQLEVKNASHVTWSHQFGSISLVFIQS